MKYGKVPEFIKRLRERDAIAARALEFLILTAARTSEVLNATSGMSLTSRMLYGLYPPTELKNGRRACCSLVRRSNGNPEAAA